MQIHVVPVPWTSHREQLQSVREKVFIVEQGVPREIEWDGADEGASHFLAVNEAGQAIGCARLLPSGQIGRMAVLPEHRNRGLGMRLLEAAVEEAGRQGFDKVFLHAQSHAAEFYRRAGFRETGEEFMEAGIPHLAMDMQLPIAYEQVADDLPPPAVQPESADRPEQQAKLTHMDGESDCLSGLIGCLDAPVRTLNVYTQLLDHVLFDAADVVEGISRFVRGAPQANVQILIHSSDLAVSRGHRLVELARRLDSKIKIRRVPDELATDDHSYVTWDNRGYWLMPDFREYDALANRYDPVQATRLNERFEYLWQKSAADPELRTLRL